MNPKYNGGLLQMISSESLRFIWSIVSSFVKDKINVHLVVTRNREWVIYFLK